ncbi:hypothetical protein [Streptomyces camelliae]|uniref:Transposase n=1 Tax=Streptomyces camelliae TaxID=3004093 RepID=A0ABY7PKA8_9ACTN|nr:hypothetical protein [Streptomyces sp. HUAS 2-6]WBO69791.1 hypothetical protein O1G22_44385 [Streptomyces sp. HUAS 2-6]
MGLFATVPLREQERAPGLAAAHPRGGDRQPAAAGSGQAPRPKYDPATGTLAQREQAKAGELTAIGFGTVARTTVQRMRLSYRAKGLWGLVDHRTTRTYSRTGRTDERVVAAVLEAPGMRGRWMPLHILPDMPESTDSGARERGTSWHAAPRGPS